MKTIRKNFQEQEMVVMKVIRQGIV